MSAQSFLIKAIEGNGRPELINTLKAIFRVELKEEKSTTCLKKPQTFVMR